MNCRICDVELTDENWSPSQRKNHSYICKNCFNLKQRKRNWELGKHKPSNRWEGKCRICKVLLTNKNWLSSCKEKNNYICGNCINKCRRDYNHNRGVVPKKEWDGTCRDCGIQLEPNINWSTINQSLHKHICNNCCNKNQRDWRRDKWLTTVDENGCKILVRCCKRPHTLVCELCGEEVSKTGYHHWDDLHYEDGLWICWKCHGFVEGIESGLGKEHVDKYIELKKKVKKERLIV